MNWVHEGCSALVREEARHAEFGTSLEQLEHPLTSLVKELHSVSRRSGGDIKSDHHF